MRISSFDNLSNLAFHLTELKKFEIYHFHANISSNAVFPCPGYDDEKSLLMSQKSLEKRFGQSPVFIAATFMEQGGIPPSTNPATLLKEAIHVISCGYEDKTDWGKEVS